MDYVTGRRPGLACKLLELGNASLVLGQIANLWGYEILLEEIDATSEEVLKAHMASPATH